MATKKNAQTQTQRAKLGFDFEDVKISKKSKNKAKQKIKKVSASCWLFALLFLCIGIAAGIGAWMFTCKNDTFELVGKDEITCTLNELYSDPGIKAISFGKDISNDILIETNLNIDQNGNYYADEVGTYYIKYYSKDLKYGTIFKVEKIRLVTYVEASEEINVDGGNQ